jgi:hypothetical protein
VSAATSGSSIRQPLGAPQGEGGEGGLVWVAGGERPPGQAREHPGRAGRKVDVPVARRPRPGQGRRQPLKAQAAAGFQATSRHSGSSASHILRGRSPCGSSPPRVLGPGGSAAYHMRYKGTSSHCRLLSAPGHRAGEPPGMALDPSALVSS